MHFSIYFHCCLNDSCVGICTIKDIEYLFLITSYDSILQSRNLVYGQILDELFQSQKEFIQQQLKKIDTSAIEVFKHICQSLKKQHDFHLLKSSTSTLTCSLSFQFLKNIILELEKINWVNLKDISNDFRYIQLQYKDLNQRLHFLQIFIISEFEKKCSTDLPKPFVTNSKATLIELYHSFTKSVDDYQTLWNILDDIDQNTWVIDPKSPTRSILFRRIALNQPYTFLHIRLSPESPCSVCECQFIGPESLVIPLRKKFNQSARLWDTKKLVKNNLENILDMKFKKKPTINDEHYEKTMECGICYTFRLEYDMGISSLPDFVCNYSKCNKVFHAICLQEWLKALPTTRHTFDNLLGKCPYCSEAITVQRT